MMQIVDERTITTFYAEWFDPDGHFFAGFRCARSG
jgi:hypothetical protein